MLKPLAAETMTLTGLSRPIVLALVLCLFGLCYAGVVASLVGVWSTNPLYSFGFAVPLIAAGIVRSRSGARTAPSPHPDYWLGVPILLVAVLMLAIGRAGVMTIVEQASLLVALGGTVLLMFGRQVLSRNWFAWLYLSLMVPIWNYPLSRLQEPSQLLSARVAVDLLHLIGVPAFRQGTVIDLSGHTLKVMAECSGVNQLIALAAMVVPAAYLWLDSPVRRVVLVAFAVAISYIGNGFRIALVGWLALHNIGDGDPSGKFHLLEGLAVSVLVYIAIGACYALLSRPVSSCAQAAAPSAVDALSMTFRLAPHRRLSVDVAMIAVMLAAGTFRLSATTRDVLPPRELGALETRILDWTMEVGAPVVGLRFPFFDDAFLGTYPNETGERRFTAVDDELVRTYRHASGAVVHIYLANYHRQEQGKELAGDVSHALQSVGVPFVLNTETGPLELREVVRDDSDRSRGVVYWFDINGRIAADFYKAKGYMLWDAVTRRRSNGAVVMIAWQSRRANEAALARERAHEFARALMSALRGRLPS